MQQQSLQKFFAPMNDSVQERVHAPISRLNEDVLLEIFLENTEMHHDHRLITAYRTSQVCRRWRMIMLRSSSIWGRLLDLRKLTDKTLDLVLTAILRSCNAPLWIKGPITCGLTSQASSLILSPRLEDFQRRLLHFIADTWHRIQMLDINVVFSVGIENSAYYQQYWTTLFNRAAPKLEVFIFHYEREFSPGVPTIWDWSPPSHLFHDTIAPKLKKSEVYSINYMPPAYPKNFAPGMPICLLSRLRSLSVHEILDVPQLFKLLKATPFLQDLSFCFFQATDVRIDPNYSSPLITLPLLTRLHLDCSSLLVATMILKGISPSSHCCLSASCNVSDRGMGEQQMTELTLEYARLAMQYIQAYFQQQRATRVALITYEKDNIGVRDQTPLQHTDWMNRLSFDISLPCFSKNVRMTGSIQQDLLTSSLFPFVEELDLCDWLQVITSKSFSICAFDSVTTLIAYTENLKFLILEFLPTPVLPQLRTLKITMEPASSGTAPASTFLAEHDGTALYTFLEHRRTLGLPIAVLDITALQPHELACELDILEEFDSLLVRWTSVMKNTKEYICGSGCPEELYFDEEWASYDERIHVIEGSEMIPYEIEHGWSGSIV